MFLTALDDPVISEEFESNIRVLRGQHLILASMMKPPGVAPLFSDGSVEEANDIVERLSGHLRWHRLTDTQRQLHAMGIQLSFIDEDKLGAEVVARYRQVKTRQLL
jgi:hypothetical protein